MDEPESKRKECLRTVPFSEVGGRIVRDVGGVRVA